MRNPLCCAACSLLIFTVGAAFHGLGSRDATAEGDSKPCKPYVMVAPLDVIMEHADEVFYDMPEGIEKGRFRTLRKDALFLAEMANVFGKVKDHCHEEKWTSFSKAMLEGSMELAEASKEKDGDAAKKLHARIEKACDSCHEAYRD